MAESDDKQWFARPSALMQESVFFLACFFYLLFKVHPIISLESQPPIFLFGSEFFNNFLSIPGGMNDWFTALFRQFWLSDFISCILLTLCYWFIAFFTRRWLEYTTASRPIHTFHLIPAGLFLVCGMHLDYHWSITIAFAINLFFVDLFNRWAPKQWVSRTVFGLVTAVVLYWITGGAFLVFALLCGLNEIIFRKQLLTGIIVLLISSILPYIGAATVFLVPVKQSYLHNLIFEASSKLFIIKYSLIGFFLLGITIPLLMRISWIEKIFQKIGHQFRFTKIPQIAKLGAGTIILAGATFLFAQDSFNDIYQLIFQTNQCARLGRWDDVLEITQNNNFNNELLSCERNFALYQKNELLNKMFAYPQNKGVAGLLLNDTWCLAWPEQASTLYCKLGLINASLHWANEALEQTGATPDILKQVGILYMIKGQREAANKIFRALKNAPFMNRSAENLIDLNGDAVQLAWNEEYGSIRLSMLHEDMISVGNCSGAELELLLKQNPKNKMAFEYLLAFNLLNGNLNKVLAHLSDFRNFSYPQIPIHVQEALALAEALIPGVEKNQLQRLVNPSIHQRFEAYKQIIFKYREAGKDQMRQELQARFADTLWYYLQFGRTASYQSGGQNEYQ